MQIYRVSLKSQNGLSATQLNLRFYLKINFLNTTQLAKIIRIIANAVINEDK